MILYNIIEVDADNFACDLEHEFSLSYSVLTAIPIIIMSTKLVIISYEED